MATKTEERPAYVRFEKQAVEDREATLKHADGRVVMKDLDMVIITPAGSKDEVVKVVSDWLIQMKQQVREGRLNPDWEERYVHAYERWKRGEEVPLNGMSVKNWPIITPAQVKNLISANVLTVEDLAVANGEALQRIGMGAYDLKQKAEAYLLASKDIGAVVQQNAALVAQNRDQEITIKELNGRLTEMSQKLAALGQPAASAKATEKPEVQIS